MTTASLYLYPPRSAAARFRHTYRLCEAVVMALLGVSTVTEVILAVLAGGLLLFVYFLYKHFYVHYQLLKSHGIKGPKPIPYFGNARDLAKLVC